jgi:hypothetical protein
VHLAVARLNTEHLSVADLTLEPFAKLIGHRTVPLASSCVLDLVAAALLHLHRLAAAFKLTVAALRHDHFGIALGTLIPFADLIRHACFPPFGSSYIHMLLYRAGRVCDTGPSLAFDAAV